MKRVEREEIAQLALRADASGQDWVAKHLYVALGLHPDNQGPENVKDAESYGRHIAKHSLLEMPS